MRQRSLAHERNRIDVTAVVRLAAMGGTAVAEEARRFRIGAEAEVFDALNFSAFEPGLDEARKVEHGVLRARRGSKEFSVRGVRRREPIDEFGADLVIRLADQRTDGGTD